MSSIIKGSKLGPKQQRQALAAFVHRYTKDHVPNWARDSKCPVQFASDADWLENTLFHVTKSGELDQRYRFCTSTPTWPDNPELRK